MKSYGMGIVNEGSWDEGRWLFSFGAYGSTHVLVVGVRSLEYALESAAGWLADNAPCHLMTMDSEEYADLLREACEEHGVSFEAYQHGDLDSDLSEQITQAAEADLTYTESGYLTSYEWGVYENPTRAAILDCQKRYQRWTPGKIVEVRCYKDSAVQSPRLFARVRRTRGRDDVTEVVTLAGKVICEGLDRDLWSVPSDLATYIASLYPSAR